MKKILVTILLISLLPGLFSQGDQEKSQNITLYVSLIPQAYFLERIGGDKVDVKVMVLPGKSPATYEPTPRQVVELGSASLFFTMGVPFEQNFLPSIMSSVKGLTIVDTSEGLNKRYLDEHHHEDEHEEGHEEEEEKTIDPHVWMSPILAAEISKVMAEKLIELDQVNESFYRQNLANLTEELLELDHEIASLLAPYKGQTIFVFHPSFGYFTDQYGLFQEAIETGGKEPSPADLVEIIDEANADGVKVIFVQPEFPKDSAQAVARAIDGSVIMVEALNPDYINNLKYLATEIGKGLQ